MCKVLEVSRSGYYAWKNRPESNRSQVNKILLKNIRESHERSRGTYGSIRIREDLKRHGIVCSKNRVARLMKAHGIQSVIRKKYKATTNSRHNLPVAENLLNQNFKVDKPNKVWVTDITYIPTDEGWLYLSAIIDLCHKKVVGWSMDSTMTQELIKSSLQQAIKREKPAPGLIHHSDRGSQYASIAYQDLLKQQGFVVSMSRKGNCFDNAVAESFFGTLKTEMVYLTKYRTRKEARQAIFEYIEVFYNRMRLHSSLGYMSPLEYEASLKLVV